MSTEETTNTNTNDTAGATAENTSSTTENVTSQVVETGEGNIPSPIINAEVVTDEPKSEDVEVVENKINPLIGFLAVIKNNFSSLKTWFDNINEAKKNWAAFFLGMVVAVGGYLTYTNWPLVNLHSEGLPKVVAVVNGESIKREQLEQSLTQTIAIAQSQGVNIEDPQVRHELETQALEVIINTRLLVQAANQANFTAEDSEIDEQLAKIEEQFGGKEALEAEASKFGLTPESLRKDIGEQIAVDKYLKETIKTDEIQVTDEEIKEAYDSVAESGATIPPLTSVKDAIREQLAAEKQQLQVSGHIDSLREQADVKIKI